MLVPYSIICIVTDRPIASAHTEFEARYLQHRLPGTVIKNNYSLK